MPREINESDWRLLSRLRPVALERFCQGVLTEIARLASPSEGSSHARYRDVFDLIRRRDKELSLAFDNPRRSMALIQLACIRSYGLLTEEELEGFSSETREILRSFDAI